MTTTCTTDQDVQAEDDLPVAGSIGWMAFLHADVIPYTAFEHD